MATGILLNVANSLVGQLVDYAGKEIGKILGIEDALHDFKGTLQKIEAVLHDADNQQQTLNYQDQDWIHNLKAVLDNAEDLLDDLAIEATKREAMQGNIVIKKVSLFFSRSNQLVYRWKMAKELEKIGNQLNKAIKDRGEIALTAISLAKISDLTDSSLPEVVIGRENDKQAIVDRLLGANEEDTVIPILGMGGMGKTTLAQMVFNDKGVSDNFDLRLWICVPRNLEKKLILQKILESLTTKKAEDLDDEILRKQIASAIDKKKFLLVLDDVWNEDQEKWDNLFKSLKDIGTSGSKIVLTTRLERAAQNTHMEIHELMGLSKPESWNLLKLYAFYQGQVPENSGLIGIGEEIAGLCLGVPLVIKTVGRLLNGKKLSEWLSFRDNKLSKIAQNKDVLERLKLSYYYLPSYLRDCFSYCTLFPKGYEIDVKTLIQLWIAQGLVRASKSQVQLEDVARQYFNELCWRSFFQDIKMDTLGNPISCRMHDFMHDLAAFAAAETAIILNENNDNPVVGKTQHISFNFDLDANWKISQSLCRATKLRTFLLPIQKLKSDVEGTNNSICEDISSTFVKLRALDLHNLGIDHVSSNIRKLKHLRYLDACRNRKLEFLPIEITKLPHLVTLKLAGCEHLKELPNDVAKMVNLMCLDCEGCWNLSYMPKGLGKLTSLQTLTWFVIAKNSSISKHIGGLKELRKLNNLKGKIEIRNLRFVKDDQSESALAKMENKEHLQSLTLSWNVETNDNDVYNDYIQRSSKCNKDSYVDANNVVDAELEEKILESLKPHKKLRVLRVYEYGGMRSPSWLPSITNLIEIWIVNCKQLQHIPPLDQLPFLRELWLSEILNLMYIDEREDTCNVDRSVFFPSLEQLRIWSCPNLYGWWKKGSDDKDPDNETTTRIVELPEFPHLYMLDVRDCPKLTWMPEFSLSNGELWFKDVDLTRLQGVSGSGKVRFLNCLTSFSNIVELRVTGCKGCRYFPPMDQLPSLVQIFFDNVKDFEYIGTEVINATRRDGEGSKFFPSLKKLIIQRCPIFKGWWKGTNNDEDNNDKIITTTTTKLPQFPCLSLLKINDCPQLIQLPLSPTLDDKLSLRNTSFNQFWQTLDMQISSRQLAHGKFSSGLSLFMNLKELSLDNLVDTEYIGIESFSLLKKVALRNCPNLKSWFKKSDDGDDSTRTARLLQFPALSTLSIIDCPILTEMPLFPDLDDSLCLRNASREPFLQTINLTTAALRNLRRLDIRNLDDLEYIGIEAFQCLESIWIHDCQKLKSWWKNTSGSGNDSPTTATATTALLEFPYFSALTMLRISNCPNLTQMPLFPFLKGLLRLENTSGEPLERTLKMMTSSSTVRSPLSGLHTLFIKNIKGVEYLPGIQNLTSLEALIIHKCQRLKSLPEGIHLLTNLKILQVKGCPLLSERCEKQKGVDWPLIAHIPTIYVDKKLLQGRPRLFGARWGLFRR